MQNFLKKYNIFGENLINYTMKFTVSSTLLLSHLQTVARIVNIKNTLPILDNFLFLLKENKLVIKASDLETTLITEVTVENSGIEGGSIAVPAKLATTALRGFAEQPITFDINLENYKIVIYSDKGEFTLMGFDADEFPELQTKDEEFTTVKMGTDVFFKCIDKSIFATADDDLRPIMNGIFVELFKNEFRFVASDAHKLVRYKRLDLKSKHQTSFILPKKPANLLRTITEKKKDEITIEFDSRNAFFTVKNYKLICRLLEGTYPNYEAVIPQDNPNHLVIDRLELANSLSRVSAFSNPSSNLIKLQLFKDKLVVSEQEIDFATSAYETLSCQYSGDELEIGFKSVFLLEILNHLGSENIVLKLADATRAGIFESYDEDNTGEEEIIMLLMPMMLNV